MAAAAAAISAIGLAMGSPKGTIPWVTLSIDYDKTWSADPALWQQFARSASSRGHIVLLVTNRSSGSAEVIRESGPYVHRVIMAGPMPKREAAARHGYTVDVWIDDRPETVRDGR